MIDGNIEQIDSYSQTSTQQIITKAIELIETFCIDSNNVGIDGVGVGAGVIDGLKSQGFDIKELIGGSKPIEPFYEEAFQANNLRSQMYYQLRQNIMDANIGKLSHKTLTRELGQIKYEISTEKTVKVMGKDIIKKTLGTSPDFADALCYANWVREEREFYPYYLPFSAGA